MLVMMRRDATAEQIQAVCDAITAMGFKPIPMPGSTRTAVGLVGDDSQTDGTHIEAMAGVGSVLYDSKPYKQVSREWKPEKTLVTLATGVVFGGDEVPVIAGPCSVESEAQIVAAARAVKAAGAVALRGGAFKPRTSPYAFQGLGKAGLEMLATARAETGLAIVTEALDEAGAELVAEYADMVQLGARNMQNFALLKLVGRLGKPVLLKRGMSATITELLLAAEYILNEGNAQVVMCERGIRSYDTATRNVFDVSAIPVVQKQSHLPMAADPSHGVGVRDLVPSAARAAIAAGADALMIEVHPDPDKARSDGVQTLGPAAFTTLMGELRVIAEAIGRSIATVPEPARR
jgi:3-deoxy-7-phosphoheptulonate synthase